VTKKFPNGAEKHTKKITSEVSGEVKPSTGCTYTYQPSALLGTLGSYQDPPAILPLIQEIHSSINLESLFFLP